MIIRLFRTNRPVVFLYLLIFTLLVRGIFLYFPLLPVTNLSDSYIGPYFVQWINAQNIPWWAMQLADIIIMLLTAVMLNLLLTSFKLFDQRSFVPALIYIVYSSVFVQWIRIHPETVAEFFMLLSLYNLFTLTGKELSRDNIFYTGFFLSIGCLFYMPACVFLPVIIFALLLRGYHFFDILLVLSGFILPWFFIGIGYYYNDALSEYLYQLQHEFYAQPFFQFDLDVVQISVLLLICIPALLGFFVMAREHFAILKLRKLIFIIVSMFLLTLVASVFITGDHLIYLQMLTLPLSIFAAKFFDVAKSGWFRNVFFIVILCAIVVFQLYYFKII